MDNLWQNTGSVLFRNKLKYLVDSTNMDAKIFMHTMNPQLQVGPTCGFAALATALNSMGCCENISLEELVELAKKDEITNFGELFSVNWLVEFVDKYWPQMHPRLIDFPTPNYIIQHLAFAEDNKSPKTLLVPYDCDKNFEPCNKDGHSAHWAILIGFVMLEKPVQSLSSINLEQRINLTKFDKSDFKELDKMHFDDQFYVIAFQGKSRHQALWSYSKLRQSNAQLNVPNPTASSNFRMAPEGIAAIRGKCCLLGTLQR